EPREVHLTHAPLAEQVQELISAQVFRRARRGGRCGHGRSYYPLERQIHVIASLLLWVWVSVWGTVVALTTLILFIPFNPLFDPKRRVILYLSGLWGWGVLLYVRRFLPVDAYGFEKLKTGGPYVLCPNHFSVADTITFLGVLPSFAFVVR